MKTLVANEFYNTKKDTICKQIRQDKGHKFRVLDKAPPTLQQAL